MNALKQWLMGFLYYYHTLSPYIHFHNLVSFLSIYITIIFASVFSGVLTVCHALCLEDPCLLYLILYLVLKLRKQNYLSFNLK